MLRTAVGTLLATALLSLGASAGDTASEQVVFTGASAPGQNTLSFAGNVYSFSFVGDETLTWQVDLSDPKVAGGMLRIHELTSDSWPIDGGGPAFRDAAGAITFPNTNFKKTVLLGHSMSGGVLTLDYRLDLNGQHPFRYELRAQGKQLRIRATDPTGNVALGDNFSGLAFMKLTGVENPVPIRMQGALADPITMFRHQTAQGTEHYFTANMLDMLQSNASDYRIGPLITPVAGPDSTTASLDTATKYEALTNGQIGAPLDDSFVIVVSSHVRDVLLDTTAPPSPYRLLLANRLFFDGPTPDWKNYDGMFPSFLSYGLYNLVGYFFFDWTASAVDPPSEASVGPDWSPAWDAQHFQSLLKQGTSLGHLLAAYTTFDCLPPTAPRWASDLTEIVLDGLGQPKVYLGLGFPLLGVEACGLHALSETAKLAQLGADAAYVDIQTFGSISKGPDGGHVDQNANSPWAKTLRQAYVGQKAWFDGMRSNLGGPLMGEGSIGNENSNMEFFNYGYVDSTQRVINTGGGKDADELPAGSPYAPTNWPIIPEYEWRVAARRQVNHGNGFYYRFFSASDGPTIVQPNGKPIFPLTQDAMDLYQAFLITYGHAGYVITDGTDTPADLILYPQVAQTYFLTNALQSLYFASPIANIRYFQDGAWKSFEAIAFAAESLEPFRHIPVRLDFANGLRIYVNHASTPMTIVENGGPYVLPAKTGWWAGLGSWFLSFSASAPGTNDQRIDYCKATGQYEYFNGRGVVAGFGSLSNPAKRSAWKLTPTNVSVVEDAAGQLTPTQGPFPAYEGISLFPGEVVLAKGARTGLKAIASFQNGGVLDLTTMLDWYSTKPWVASVTKAGIVSALNSGEAKIVAVGPGAVVMSAPMTVTVP